MTQNEIQELRDWSARKMGWNVHGDHYCVPDSRCCDPHIPDSICYVMATKETTSFGSAWHPDTDLNQCFLLVEKMREEGFYLRLDDNTDNHYIADFYDDNGLFYRDSKGSGFSDNPALAIIMAAKATEETNE